MKILIVEDDMTLGTLMVRAIGRIRSAFPEAVIMLVKQFAVAMREIESLEPPDVLFLDLTLPDSDFEHTASAIDAIDERVSVIVVTGQREERVREFVKSKQVQIKEKDNSLWTTDGLLRLILTALSFRRDRNQVIEERFQRLDRLLNHAPAQ